MILSDAMPSPEPCLRCKSVLPLTTTPRGEVYVYTALVSFDGTNMKTDVNQQPRGRLCEGCTRSFVKWLSITQHTFTEETTP